MQMHMHMHMHACMHVHVCTPRVLGLFGFAWARLGLLGLAWDCLDFLGFARVRLGSLVCVCVGAFVLQTAGA